MSNPTITADVALIREAATRCGGGSVHMAVQYTAAYEMAIARYNHRNTKPERKPEIAAEIRQLEAELYRLSMRKGGAR